MKPIIWLAPMDGFTDVACRCITQEIRDKYGEKDRYDFRLWTEFMTADGFIRNPEWVIHHLNTTANQTKLTVQIFWGNLDALTETVQKLQENYADRFIGIELNMWCPAQNIMRSGGWSELLKDKENALNMIKTLRENCKMPFSIKTRTGVDMPDKAAQLAFLIKASQYVDIITIHGRTTKQWYGPGLDWDFIYIAKTEIARAQWDKVKVLWNGGIIAYEEIDWYIKHLDGIMIGQAAIGNPWIFTPHIPSHEEKRDTILHHLSLIPDTERNNIEFRKHLFQYIKWIPSSKERKVHMAQIKDRENMEIEITKFFNTTPGLE